MERRKISREGKYIFLQRRQNTEKEKEDYIWRRKLHFCEGEGKGGKYLEKETIFFEEEKKNVKNIWRRKIAYWQRQRSRRRGRRKRRRRSRRKIPGIGRYPVGPTKMPFGREVLLTLLILHTFSLLLYDFMDL